MTDHHADRPQEVRAFFASRAATWDTKFPDDGPAYAAGVAELHVVFDAERAVRRCRQDPGAALIAVGELATLSARTGL